MLLLLRHSFRNIEDIYFDCNLNEKGVKDSQTNVITQLEKYTIKKIYVSPFIRCLETVMHYCKKHDIKVVVDYRLSEFNIETRKLTALEYNKFGIQEIHEYSIQYPESYEKFVERINDFAKECPNEETLVCSHEIVIKHLLEKKVGYSYGYHEMGKVYIAFHQLVYVQPLMPMILLMIKILSLKECGINYIKSKAKSSWSFLITKTKESLGCLKENITNAFPKWFQTSNHSSTSEEESLLTRLD